MSEVQAETFAKLPNKAEREEGQEQTPGGHHKSTLVQSSKATKYQTAAIKVIN